MKFEYEWRVSKRGIRHISRICLPRDKFKERLNENRTISKSGCWIWTGTRSPRGYGTVMFQCKATRVHRLAWTLYMGEIPEKMEVCHRCDNPPCFNPEHLYLGTHSDNMLDAAKKGRIPIKRGEKHPMAKLNCNQVNEIRKLYSSGEYTQKELGIRFGVVQSTVCWIVSHGTWRSLS